MPIQSRAQRDRAVLSEARRLIAEDVARIVAADEAKAAARRQPEGR